MLILLNLTAPPVLLLFLPAAVVGNYTLPAPPLSDVAAFTPGGAPLPTWVVNGTLYVLQNGDPAVAVYIPRYENTTGIYKITVKSGAVVVQAPPGVMIQDVDRQPTNVVVNKTGLYLYLTAPVTITYYFFTITKPPTTTTPTTTTPTPSKTPTATTPATATTPTAPPTTQVPTQTPTPATTRPATQQTQPEWLPTAGAVAVAAAAAAGVVAYVLKKKESR